MVRAFPVGTKRTTAQGSFERVVRSTVLYKYGLRMEYLPYRNFDLLHPG